MKSNKDWNITSHSYQNKTLFDFSSNHKILPANKVDKKTLSIRPNNIGIDKLTREIADTKPVNKHLSPSPNKKKEYIQSLKDSIFSPGDGASEKNQSKNLALISELSKKLLSSPLLTKTSDQQPKTKSMSIGNSNPTLNQIPSSIIQPAPLKYLPEKSYYNLHRKTLILDLDETLVHSNFKSFYAKSDIVLNIPFDEKNHTIHVLKRPYVDEFLDKMSRLYELVIFTASIPEYANPLLNKLDINKRISSRLFREHCTTSNNLFIKDLRKVGRNLKDTILLDNNPVSYALNKENGLPILTWHSNKGDTELLKLIPLLEHLAKVDDVREVIKKVVSGNYLNYTEVNRFINPKEEEKNNLNYTINYGLNNGGTSASNCSMNLFSHHFSSIYFDEKEKEKEKKAKEKEIESFNNCFDTKKNNIGGGALVFEDKRYQEKYDRFYESKGLNCDELIKKELNEQIILPSNTSCQYRDREKNKFNSGYNSNNNINVNRAHSALSQDDQYTFIKANNSNNVNDFVNNYGSNGTLGINNTYQKSTYASPKKDSDTTSKLNALKFERNKLDFYQGAIPGNKAAQTTSHFTKKATISLQEQQQQQAPPVISHNSSALNQLSNWEFNIHPIKSCFGLGFDNNKNTSAKESITQSKVRTISQTLREKEKNSNTIVKAQLF